MSQGLPRPADLRPGDSLPPLYREIGWEEIRRFNRYVTGGNDTKNIHTDDEVARRAGLPRAVAAGRHPVAFIAEWMTDLLGAGFLAGGEIEVTFVKPIYPGDRLQLTATVNERAEEEGGTRLLFEVALLNQENVPVTVGSASGLLLSR
ncbi:MAG: hypothetical protein A3J27_12335 [Candidatus Tectomicrobia bacterium RIFCSPLOWO2_12_FULL_69_37]|nr:MAG: hypothetical protein A3I72_03730 [Candidatus Tectomicrobia bacterium RIFCSPLOWO2_02_FULL_70_19]OGL60959.1 MAG: hypothetical protein A3J27_12335 [Candidatus Tectomicrobia bacterium RIFCSPLOWO2_12_FULL_69_37]